MKYIPLHLLSRLAATVTLFALSAVADDVRVVWDNGGGDQEFTNPNNWNAGWDPSLPGGNPNQLPGYEAGAPSNAIMQTGGVTNLNSPFTPANFFTPLIVRGGHTFNINADLTISGTDFRAGQTGTGNTVNQNAGTLNTGGGNLSIGDAGFASTGSYNLNGGNLIANTVNIVSTGVV